jgi:hypothetical protein
VNCDTDADAWNEFYRLLREADRHIRDMREIAVRLAITRADFDERTTDKKGDI